MDLNYTHLSQHPTVFRSLSGISVAEFEGLVAEVEAMVYAQLAAEYPSRERKRAAGGRTGF